MYKLKKLKKAIIGISEQLNSLSHVKENAKYTYRSLKKNCRRKKTFSEIHEEANWNFVAS